jgi:hypothetical protein
LILAACGGHDDPAPAPAPAPVAVPPVPAPVETRLPPPPPPRVTVHWTNVVRTDGCFFFSGPEGRDDQLVGDVRVETVEREGEHIQLRIGTAVFDGTYAHGDLSVSRTSQHDFEGPWTASEWVRGHATDGRMDAHYAYEECEVNSHRCPGPCRITGDLTFSRAL